MITIPSGLRRNASPEIRIDKFGGEDSSTTATQIATNRAEKMENLMLDTQGMLQQIPGYRRINGPYFDPTAIQVATAQDLYNVRNNLAGNYIQVADIDISGYDWEPIGTAYMSTPFIGKYDGGGYTISGLTINRPLDQGLGLFGEVEGELRNINITGFDITGLAGIGGIAMNIVGTVVNCHVQGTIHGDSNLGGLVNSMYPDTGDIISNCSADVDIYSEGSDSLFIGGFASSLDAYDGANIEKCFSKGRIFLDATNSCADIGGFVGTYEWSDATSKITDCYSTVDIYVINQSSILSNIGGFVGSAAESEMVNCFSTGIVPTLTLTDVGGFAGDARYGTAFVCTLTNCFYDSTRSGHSDNDGRGVPKTTAQMVQTSTYTGFDFTDTWDINVDVSPYPTFIPEEDTPVRMLTWNRTLGKFLKSYGGKIYSFLDGTPETEVYSPVSDRPMRDFFMGSHQYFLNGAEYIRFDGASTFATVESAAFIPTTVIGRLPSGGGTAFEAVNLLQPKRKNSFIGNGTATIFQLDTIGLDATLVTATVAGVAKAETTDFTVNRTTGVVTFTSAPADGAGVDNVIITFAKTVSGYADRVKKCNFFAIYGVGNNLRVFLSGNPDYKNQDWYSAMQDPTYFPDLNYTKIGSEGVAIKGYALQQGAMHILKEDSNYDPTIWTRRTEYDSNGMLYFPVRPNNASIGLLATNTVRVVNDVPFMLTKKGVFRITSTYVEDERGLDHLSANIDSKLMAETDLSDAIAYDFEGKYGIALNDKIYIIDYNNGYECYRWNGIPAACFCEYEGNLYFGSNDSGDVYVMNKFSDSDNTNNFDGRAIESYWYSKMFSMDRSNFHKMIDSISVTLAPVTAMSSVDIYYSTNKKTEKFVKRLSIRTSNFQGVDFSDFSFSVSNLPQSVNREVNIDDIIYFQIILKNSELSVGMAISNITVPYFFAGEI